MTDTEPAPVPSDHGPPPHTEEPAPATQLDVWQLPPSPPARRPTPAAESTNEQAQEQSPTNPSVTLTTTADARNESPLPTSSAASTKGDETPASAPYGTRSRIRTGPRPNYSDDLDMNFEAAARKVEVAAKKSTTSLESATNGTAAPEDAEVTAKAIIAGKARGFTAANAPSQQTNGTAATQQNGSTATPPPEAPQSKTKRKYTWKQGTKPSPSSQSAQKDAIPGTSSFSTSLDTPDAPPSKKRKTGEHLTNGVPSGPPTAAAPRKAAASNGARALARETAVVTFHKSGAVLKNGQLHADDGTVYGVDDTVYLICEPPGDPYYLCRIMEFHKDEPDDPKAPVTSILVNWFYRPKDIARFSVDTRLLYASMQSDESPLNALRGKCTIKHRSEIGPSQAELEDYKRGSDCFWFSELYDRYIHRPYNMVPAKAVINVPSNVKKAIDERWRFLVVEPTRQKELTSAIKSCKRCGGYCAPNDSVDCGVCTNTYHMQCVNPPLAKKPSRGFAWSCGPCSRAQEKKLEARSGLAEGSTEAEEEGHEEEEEAGAIHPEDDLKPPPTSDTAPMTHDQAEAAKAQLWPWRYLGIHCNVEDVLQYDDRAIYPRASSRLGARHQAVVNAWCGRPVELVKPVEIKKKYTKGATNKKDAKLSKDTIAALEADKAERAKRPIWVQDEPPGYVARGEDYDPSDERCTATRLFVVAPAARQPRVGFAAANAPKPPSNEQVCDSYLERVNEHAARHTISRLINVGPMPTSGKPAMAIPTNYLDRALNSLYKHEFDAEKAFTDVTALTKPDQWGDPVLSKEELKKFEDGVAKFGSELRYVKKHVKSRPYGQIVRFYYNWKKSARGREVWGKHDARRGSKKRAEASWTEIADDEDDSAFDNGKSAQRKRRFLCKFCNTKSSRQWRRAPGIAPGAVAYIDPKGSTKDKANQLVLALCQRCAYPWRRYSIKWEDPEEFAKSLNAPGGRQWKRLQDEMMLRECVLANESAGIPTTGLAAAAAASIGITLTVPIPAPETAAKKKLQPQDKESTPSLSGTEAPKKRAPPATAAPPPRPTTPPPIVFKQPELKKFPCAVCTGDESVAPLTLCSSCKLTVHRHCYAVPEHASAAKWTCDTCANDKNSIYSLSHNCVLCPVSPPDRVIDMVERPKPSHKKKTDRDREKEAGEAALADELALKYKREQQSKGRPTQPREALKHTANNNWVHVTCAMWIPEIKFGNASQLNDAEGMAAMAASPSRMEPKCKLCMLPGVGATVACHHCSKPFHVSCAHDAGYRFGFDIKPVKGSKKDSGATLAFGTESGLMTAVIYCKEHDAAATSILHDINERNGKGETAFEAFVKTYKQADTTLTGTARKANMLVQSAKVAATAVQAAAAGASSRHTSLINNSKVRRASVASTIEDADGQGDGDQSDSPDSHECATCRVGVSFRWWPMAGDMLNGDQPQVNGETPKHGKQKPLQCHKCHIAQANGRMPTPPASDADTEEEEASPEVNYFRMTMQPPPQHHFEVQLPMGQQPMGQQPMGQQPMGQQPMGQQTSQQPQMPAWNAGFHPPGNPPEPAGGPSIDQWTRILWAATITLTMVNGKAIHYRGTEFGDLNDPPSRAWQHLTHKAAGELGFELGKQLIKTGDQVPVSSENALMKALADVIKSGNTHAYWHVEELDVRDVFQPPQPQWRPQPLPGVQQAPPPAPPPPVAPPFPASLTKSQSQSSGPSPVARPPWLPPQPSQVSPIMTFQPTLPSIRHSSHTQLPPAPPRRETSETNHVSRPSNERLPPFGFPQAPPRTDLSNIAPELRGDTSTPTMPNLSANYFAQTLSPPATQQPLRSPVASNLGGAGGGASSSPSLKNLMHM